ncbi:cyclin B1 interacting protein 1, E3 ubiquitin protein ligase [Mortierella sp. 14UC]|nr:cyclin B1 interacting protein 1, E3 ubiquitin protein ligase [Mortierella sp. 14UC]
MEICTRAISFWTYQTSQEAKYQEMAQKKLEDKIGQLERQLQRMTREVNVELNGFHDTVNALQKDIEQEKRKSADLTDQLDEKSRQLTKLQTMYDRQKRRPLFPSESSSVAGGIASQLQGRSLFLDEGVQPAGVLGGIGADAALRGDPYQLYHTLDTDATPRPFVKQVIATRSSMPSLYSNDPTAFAYGPPSTHAVHATPAATAPSVRVNNPTFAHGSIGQRTGGVVPIAGGLGAGRPLSSGKDFSQQQQLQQHQQHSMPSQLQEQHVSVPSGLRGGYYHAGPGTPSLGRM